MKRPSLLLALLVLACCQRPKFIVCSAQSIPSSLTWTNYSPGNGPPAFAGWNIINYDPVAQMTFVYALANATTQTGLYATNFSYANLSAATPSWSLQPGGTQYANDTLSCAATNNANQPKPRHPYGFPIIDTTRNLAVLLGGSCAGGITDMVYEVLHSSISSNNGTFTVVSPGGGTYPNTNQFGAGVYDNDDDVYIDFGYNGGAGQVVWIYCPTIPVNGGSPTGSLTTKQTNYGRCSSADTWLNITSGTQPPNSSQLGYTTLQLPSMVYDSTLHKVWMYGGADANFNTFSNQLWWYVPSTNAWTESSGTRPPVQTNPTGVFLPMALDTKRDILWLHIPTSASGLLDYYYTPGTDTWHSLGNQGGETDAQTIMQYDPINDRLISFGLKTAATTFADVWATAPLGPSSTGNSSGGSMSGGGNFSGAR